MKEKLKSITTWIGLLIILIAAFDIIKTGVSAEDLTLLAIGGGFIFSKDGNFKRI